MPINASIEFDKAKAKYEAAQTPSEKMEALSEMRSLAPNHKGAENLRVEITGKIAKLREEIEKQKLAKKSTGKSINVKKDGDGQIVILGLPNTGKSTLLKKITGVNVEIAPYPFTTSQPEIGMMDYKGAKVQLIEVPAIIEGSGEGKANGTQLLSLARNADAVIITCQKISEKEIVAKELEKTGIIVFREKPKIAIKQSQFRGITISGKQHLKMSENEFESTLKSFGIFNASVHLEEQTDQTKLMEALDQSLDYKKTLTINPMEETDLEKLKEKIFLLLGKIIVYTKKPGSEPDYNDPLVMKNGATISDAAEIVHKELAKNLKFAKVWGSSKYDGQRVPKDYVLQSGDVVEMS
ncbi:MAG: TGS domain-containing protein [archaeon]|nr:TGS domain-containing protein [archaeon]